MFYAKKCTYVQNVINGNDEKMDFSEDIEHTYVSTYFVEKTVFTVEIFEETLNESNLERVQNEGKFLSSHEHDKDRTVQHTKKKGTLPKIASPAKKNISDAEFSDDTFPIKKENGVNDRKYDKNKECNEDK